MRRYIIPIVSQQAQGDRRSPRYGAPSRHGHQHRERAMVDTRVEASQERANGMWAVWDDVDRPTGGDEVLLSVDSAGAAARCAAVCAGLSYEETAAVVTRVGAPEVVGLPRWTSGRDGDAAIASAGTTVGVGGGH